MVESDGIITEFTIQDKANKWGGPIRMSRGNMVTLRIEVLNPSQEFIDTLMRKPSEPVKLALGEKTSEHGICAAKPKPAENSIEQLDHW